MIKANYHTHTVRCKHARGSEREYIENAIKNGFSILGFSDHVPQPFPEGYVSPIRMDMSEAEDYIETIESLKKEYEGQIEILTGFEVEYFPKYFDALIDKLRSLQKVDYIILGQHNIPDEIGGFYCGEPTGDVRKLKAYVDQCIEGLDTGLFTYLAHPDLINFKGDKDIYLDEMRRICEYSIKNDVPLEFNMLGFRLCRNYPNESFFKMASSMGCRFIIGCDAHDPGHVCQPESVEDMTDFITRCGIKTENENIIKTGPRI